MKQAIAKILTQPKDRKIAVGLALLGSTMPFVSGVHKFYMGQPVWGVVYLLLHTTPLVPQVACAIEAVWYLLQDFDTFQERFGIVQQNAQKTFVEAQKTTQMAEALRELEKLRTEGLITEYEFEQKRRQLLT